MNRDYFFKMTTLPLKQKNKQSKDGKTISVKPPNLILTDRFPHTVPIGVISAKSFESEGNNKTSKAAWAMAGIKNSGDVRFGHVGSKTAPPTAPKAVDL